MKIKLFTHISCEFGNFRAGETCELPDHIAKALVEGKHAEAVEEVVEAPAKEVAENSASIETAEAPEAKPARRRK